MVRAILIKDMPIDTTLLTLTDLKGCAFIFHIVIIYELACSIVLLAVASWHVYWLNLR